MVTAQQVEGQTAQRVEEVGIEVIALIQHIQHIHHHQEVLQVVVEGNQKLKQVGLPQVQLCYIHLRKLELLHP
ncbi:hypothetical protein D3C74_433970 [compost metagenome]